MVTPEAQGIAVSIDPVLVAAEQLTEAELTQEFALFEGEFATNEDPANPGEILPGYKAGLPGYPGNFTRDVLKTAYIAGMVGMARKQLRITAAHLGTKYDPLTGEEPGKGHHEFPGMALPRTLGRVTADGEDLRTTYNACDTSALFAIGAEMVANSGPAGRQEATQYTPQLKASADYIMRHTVDGLFWEWPPAGADPHRGFSLRTTYWKDSILLPPAGLTTDRLEPLYPVSFALAHVIAARGLLAASRVLQDPALATQADTMFRAGIDRFFAKEKLVVAVDQLGERVWPASDELHALAYMPREYAGLLPKEAILQRAETLYTSIGIACTDTATHDALAKANDTYHARKVWTHEQALIHAGAIKFGLQKPAEVARRVLNIQLPNNTGIPQPLSQGVELFNVDPIEPQGNRNQLWAVAALLYLRGRTSLRPEQWL